MFFFYKIFVCVCADTSNVKQTCALISDWLEYSLDENDMKNLSVFILLVYYWKSQTTLCAEWKINNI